MGIYWQPNFVQLSVYVSLIFLGVIKNPKHRITYLVVYIGVASFLITGSIFGLLACREVSQKLQVLPPLLLQITILLMFVDTLLRSGSIVELLKCLKKGRRCDYILDRANTIMKESIVWYVIANVGLFLLAFVPSLVYYADPRTTISEKNSLAIPYWFSCGDVDGRKTNASHLICLPVRTRSQLIISNAFVTPALGVLGWIACSQLIVYSVSINELLIHTEIFASMIYKLNTTIEDFHQHCEFVKLPSNQILQHQRNMHDELVKIIQYQQFIKNCIFKSIRTWKTYNALYVCDLFVAIALMLLFIVTEKDEELFLAFRMGCVCAICFVGFVLICLCGHTISGLNDILLKELCTIPWYHQNKQFCRLYAITLMQNATSIDMKMLGVYRVNLHTILSLIKSAYSLLNVLLLMSK